MNLNSIFKNNKLLFVVAFFASVVFFVFFFQNNFKIKASSELDQNMQKREADYQSVLNSVEAKSFYVYDISENKTLFSKDEHLKLPLASITKIMSGLVALDVMPDTTIITISKNDIILEGDSGLIVGEKWKLKDLLNFTLIESSNDGMGAIASTLNSYEIINNINAVGMMNKKAKRLGLKDTVFINETGLDIDDNMSGAYSSAYDVSLLLKTIVRDNLDLISSTNKQSKIFISESNIKHTASNTNVYMNQIPGLIASKTGLTDLAGGNLAVILDVGFMHPVVIVVLGSTTNGRFTDVIKLANITLSKLSE